MSRFLSLKKKENQKNKMLNAQSFANETGNYKTILLDEVKPVKVRRGRACTRREKRVTTHETRILRDRLLAHSTHKEYRKELKAFEKSCEGMPKGVTLEVPENIKQLKDMAAFHNANHGIAMLTKEAMSKFPPLS